MLFMKCCVLLWLLSSFPVFKTVKLYHTLCSCSWNLISDSPTIPIRVLFYTVKLLSDNQLTVRLTLLRLISAVGPCNRPATWKCGPPAVSLASLSSILPETQRFETIAFLRFRRCLCGWLAWLYTGLHQNRQTLKYSRFE